MKKEEERGMKKRQTEKMRRKMEKHTRILRETNTRR